MYDVNSRVAQNIDYTNDSALEMILRTSQLLRTANCVSYSGFYKDTGTNYYKSQNSYFRASQMVNI